jgi:ABC-type lipoprotein release transport system permease subunit
MLCIIGVALAATFVVAVGATTTRYMTVIKEMNVLFSGQVMVVSKNAIVIQAIPITRGMLQEKLAEELEENFPEIEKAVPVLFVTPSIYFGGNIFPVPENFSIGVPVENWRMVLGPTPLKGGVGHFPTSDSSNEIVIGGSLAEQYDLTVGDILKIQGYDLEIVGVLDTKMAVLNRCMLMSLKLAQKIYNYQGSVNIIAVKPVQGYPQQNLSKTIEERVKYVSVLTEEDRNDIIQPILAQIETWNLGIQSVVFVMSLILVMTVTIMSVSERRRDFATLDAIGAPLSYVFRAVLLETVIIGVLGGAFGIIFGSLVSLVLASLYTNIPLHLIFPSVFEIVPPLYMLQIFTAIVIVCCLGGIIPAINATKIRVAETLRAEY